MVLFLYGRFTTSTAQEITVSSGFLSTHMLIAANPSRYFFYIRFISANVFIHLTSSILYSLQSDCRKDNKIETLTLNFRSPFFTFAKFLPWESRNSHILNLLCRAVWSEKHRNLSTRSIDSLANNIRPIFLTSLISIFLYIFMLFQIVYFSLYPMKANLKDKSIPLVYHKIIIDVSYVFFFSWQDNLNWTY